MCPQIMNRSIEVKIYLVFIRHINSSLRVCEQPLLLSCIMIKVIISLKQVFKPPLHEEQRPLHQEH